MSGTGATKAPRPDAADGKTPAHPAKRNRTERDRLLNAALYNIVFSSPDLRNKACALLVNSPALLTRIAALSIERRFGVFRSLYDVGVRRLALKLRIKNVTEKVLNGNVEVIASDDTIATVNRRHVDVRGALARATIDVINVSGRDEAHHPHGRKRERENVLCVGIMQ
jgi:hypothetical protein